MTLSQCKRCKSVHQRSDRVKSNVMILLPFRVISIPVSPPKPNRVQRFPPHSNGMLIVGPIDIVGLIDMDMVMSSVSALNKLKLLLGGD